MNKSSGRIRALSRYLIIAYQSHNNKSQQPDSTPGGPKTKAWVSRYQYPRSSNKQHYFCYGKSQVRITRDFLFVGLRKNWFTYFQMFTSKFVKNRRTSPTKFSVSYEKDTTKDSEARQLIKPWTTRTIPNSNEPKPLFETGQCVVIFEKNA